MARQERGPGPQHGHRWRIGVVAVALIVPLLLAAGALLVQQQVALRLTQREIVGLGYLDRGYAVLDGLESYAETAGERPADRDRAAAAVDDRLDTLEKYAAQSAARVDLRKDVAAIRADWRTAKQPGASEQSLNRTIDRGVLLCFRLGDHAGYFADASPTVATLSDVVVAEYAGVAAKIGHSATILERAARRGRLTYDDRFDATTYESQARFEFEAARGDLDSLATWRPGLRPQLPGLLAGVRQSVFAFAGPINHDVIRAENPRFARSTFSRASARVRESVAGAERNVTALLRSDLETRATRITQTIALIAIATFAAIALAVYLLRALTLVFVRRERHALTVAAAETERSRLAFEHDRAVDAMASTEARFRAIFNGSTVGMAIIDLDGCTLEQNEALSRTFGRFDVRTLGYDERELHAVLSGRCERIVCEVAVGNGRADRRWLSANLSLVRDDDQRARFAMAIFQDVTERRRMDERLQFEARHDALTGLANRAAFVAALDEMLASPAGERGAVLFLDLDKFKLINDVAGHHAGDRVIQRAAHRMRSAVRASDLVARLGGDEFAILIRNIHDRTHLTRRVRTLSQAIGQPIRFDGRELFVGATIGVLVATEEYTTVEAVLRDADAAMYHARTVDQRFAFYDDSMRAQVARKADLMPQLRAAVQREDFTLAFQPIVDLFEGKIVAFEALLRWQHPRLGMISPAEFVPIAEELGLMVPLGRLVFREACAALARLRTADARWQDLRMNVNVSARELVSADYVDYLVETVGANDLDPSSFLLEITESVLLERGERVGSAFERLKELGFGIGIDDFGTGYSSLSYLQRFAFDELKIDRSFVASRTGGVASAAIVAAVLSLGRSVGVRVVAEGVETAEQAQTLAAMGCTAAQGHWFGVPRSFAEIQAAYGRKWSLAS